MINEHDVREKMVAVLQHEISISDFARWIMSNSWNMHQDSSPSAVSLVSDIHSMLAERDDFVVSDDQFLAELFSLNSNVAVTAPVDVDESATRSPYVANSEPWIAPAIRLVLA